MSYYDENLNQPRSAIEDINDAQISLNHRMSVNELVDICHGIAAECGWWSDTTERDVPRLLMLCVSELSEAMEGHRKNLSDDHLPNYDMLTVELADCMIRILDMAGGLKLDLANALVDKLQYNTKRADHKPENRNKEDGKKY